MYEVRVLEPRDAKAYRAIRLEALKTFPEHFGSGYEQQVKLEKLYFEMRIEERSDKAMMVGAFLNSELVGICGVTFQTQVAPDAGEIIQMYVKPANQNAGVGGKMLAAINNLCRAMPVKTLLLEVYKSNQNAIRVYEACGYRVNAALGENPGSQYMTMALSE
ncbi:GNAT family N-acetyltransferase [Hahella sp. NBU794]|uniref:GNAT family N-acetyltransferase n=1 Tax=Hahella sp. NBU794 TaxID=3422590 RepID=UPI003D6E8149